MKQATELVVSVNSVTPSGIEVEYQAKPKRRYRLRGVSEFAHIEGVNLPPEEWVEVPSVTTVLEVLDKPALPWWGMRIGVEGVTTLHNMGLLRSIQHGYQRVLACPGEGSDLVVAGAEQIIELLSKHQLTTNHVRDKAGDRGQSCHDAFQLWAEEGVLPDPSIFPPQEQGYVLGLLEFFKDARVRPLSSEVMVGSLQHGYAGRYDVRMEVIEDSEVVVHRTPVRGPQHKQLDAGMKLLGDLKTSKGVYPSHSRQLEAYEAASVECGYEPTDARGILNVHDDGTYEFKRSWATIEDFLCVLQVWHSDQRMKARRAA